MPQALVPAAAGAAAVVVTGRGDVFLLAALLSMVALDRRVAFAVFAAATALLARWGTSSLPALAGAQSVLGLGVTVGPLPAALAVGLAAVAVFLAAPAGRLGVVFGAAAGVVVAGPAWSTVPGASVRILALAGGAAAVWWLQPRLPERAREAAPFVGLAAVVAGALA